MVMQKLNISAMSERELEQRIKDLEDRDWAVKQIVEVEAKHYQDYSYGESSKRLHRSDATPKKYRAVMIKDYQG